MREQLEQLKTIQQSEKAKYLNQKRALFYMEAHNKFYANKVRITNVIETSNLERIYETFRVNQKNEVEEPTNKRDFKLKEKVFNI